MIKTKKTAALAMVMLAGLTTACGKQEPKEEQTPEVVEEVTVVEEEVLEEETSEDDSNVNELLEDEETDSNEDEELVLADEMIEVSDLELLKKLIDKKETFFVVISARTCGDCKLYHEETLNHYSKDEVGIHLVKIEWTDLSEEQKAEVRELTKLGIEWTPTTFLFKDGESVEKYEENLTINKLKEIANK